MIQATARLEIYPFDVPTVASVKNPTPGKHPSALPLALLDAETLGALCDKFRDDLFKQTGGRPSPVAEVSATPINKQQLLFAFENLKGLLFDPAYALFPPGQEELRAEVELAPGNLKHAIDYPA